MTDEGLLKQLRMKAEYLGNVDGRSKTAKEMRSDADAMTRAAARIEDLRREADRRLDAIEGCLRLLKEGLPITAYENLKDHARSMDRLVKLKAQPRNHHSDSAATTPAAQSTSP